MEATFMFMSLFGPNLGHSQIPGMNKGEQGMKNQF